MGRDGMAREMARDLKYAVDTLKTLVDHFGRRVKKLEDEPRLHAFQDGAYLVFVVREKSWLGYEERARRYRVRVEAETTETKTTWTKPS